MDAVFLRQSGIPAAGPLEWGTHFCQFYRSRNDLLETLVPYFKAGLESNEFCRWITSDPLDKSMAENALAAVVPDLFQRIARGQMEILDYTEWYAGDGGGSRAAVLPGWKEKLASALKNGYEGLRLTVNTNRPEQSPWPDFSTYEAAADQAVFEKKILALCTYSLEKCGSVAITEAITNHEFTVIKRGDTWHRIDTARPAVRHSESVAKSKQEMALLANLLDHSEQPFSVGYPDGRIGVCNPAFEQLTGYSVEELRNIDWSTSLTPPEYLTTERRELKRLHEKGAPVRYEKEYIRKDGSRVPVELFVHLSRTPQGDPEYYYAFLTDLTERRKAETALVVSESRYHSLYTAMSEGMALHEIVYDPATGQVMDYRIIDVNPAFEKITGISREQAVNALASQLYGSDEPPYLAVYARVTATGVPEKLETYFSPMKKSFRISVYSPLKDHFATVFEDITDRRRAERKLEESRQAALNIMQDAVAVGERLKESEARLKRAQEVAHLGSWELDIASGELAWSDEVFRIFGLEPGACKPTCDLFLEKVHPDDRETVNTAYSESLKNAEAVYEIDHRIVRSDTGEIRHVHEKCEHERDDSGKVIRSVGMVHDITEQKQAEAERETTTEFIQLINGGATTRGIVRTALEYLQRLSGCEGVGLRLKEGGDFPYYETRGYPADFIEKENLFCSTDNQGNIKVDENGRPLLECMCSNIICGRFDPEKDFFSRGGSFWTNSTTDLLASTTDNDRLTRTCTYCNAAGFESMALVPLFTGNERMGAVHFIDHRKGKFTSQKIDLWERLAANLAAVIAKVQSQEALRKNREDLKRAQSVGSIGSWWLDVVNNRLEWSDEHCRIFGVSPETPVTRETFISMVHPDDRYKVDQKRLFSLTEKHDVSELRIIVDDVEKWVRIIAEFEFDGSGKITGGFGTTQDITRQKKDEMELMHHRQHLEKLVEERTAELRKSQELLLHAQKMEAMGQLAGGIAHDFNNMMQVVIGYTHRTLKKLEPGNPLRENLEHVGQAAQSAATLTHRLLAFSRKQILQPSVFILNDLIRKLKPILLHSLSEDITLKMKLQPDLGRVKADASQIEQVIMNMVVNARNAMTDGGTLTIETANRELGDNHPYEKDPVPPGPYVMFAISDTGHGIDETIIEKIFEPFFTTRPFGSGSGLGLATAYGTIRQSGGAVRVYSEQNSGTTFKIFLPRTEEQVKPDGQIKVNTHAVSQVQGKTILVVEDNAMTRDFVARELEGMGCTVLQAPDSEQALDSARAHRGTIHLLLSDVVLPGKSGVELAAEICRERPELQTLFMSGYNKDNAVMQKKFVSGARLLVKPFSPERLADAVADILNSSDRDSPPLIPDGDALPVKILVVDDDPGIADFLVEVISEPWNKVRGAETGTAALNIIKKFTPDVVLLDIRLPDMDGYELSRRVNKTLGNRKPFIIAASGVTPSSEAATECFDEFIAKPVDFTKLKKLITERFNIEVTDTIV